MAVLKAQTSPGVWVPVIGGSGDVWVGPAEPVDPGVELWFDTDETATEVFTKTDVLARLPKSYSATGIAFTGQAASWTTVCTLVIPAQPVAGKLHTTGWIRVDKTAADVITIGVFSNAAVLTATWPDNIDGNVYRSLPAVSALAASTAATLTIQMQRGTGSGNFITYSDYPNNHIDALWIAD